MKTILHIVKKMLMTLLITAIVIAISIAIMSVNQTAGIILMMLYSSFMIVKSSGKEMPLNTFTALLPGLMSLVVFLIMLGMIGVHDETMPLIGIGLGIIPGWLMARAHKLYKKNGIVYAKRTFIYIIIWVLSLLFTQGSTLAGMRDITDFGFLLNGFSTAMMVVLSVMLIYKTHNNQKLNLSAISNFILITFFLTLTVVPFLKLEAQEDTQIPSWVRNPPKPRNFHPAGLMSNSRRITDPDKLDRYRRTFQNRNRSRTADEKARAIQHSGLRTNRVSGSSSQGNYQHNPHIHSHIDSSPAFSDNEITAGAAAALLMLLGSLSLNAAMLAAQGVAQGTVQTAENTAFGGVSYVTEEDKDARESNSDGFVRGTRMLDGVEAEEWMMNHGYIINGQPTSRYTDFINSMPTDRAEGLQGIAGEMDEEGNPIGDYVIIVDDENINISQIDDSLNHEPSEEHSNPDEADNSNYVNENNNEDNTEHEENTASNYATTETSENNSDESSIDTSDQNSTVSTQETTLDEPEKEIPSVDYSHAREDLESIMDNLIKDKIKDKYYVRNPDFISNIFNNYPGWIIYEKFGDYKGGQCGEYAAWGVEWSKDAIRDRFGKNVKFELISVRSNFWSKIDHGATRVTLPNGEKYVLDFWEGIQDEKPHVYTENEWVQKNQDKYNIAGQGTKLEYNPSQDMLDKEWRDKHERILNNFIKNLGEEEGKKRFLEQVQKQDRNDLGDAEDIIKNWEVNHDTK